MFAWSAFNRSLTDMFPCDFILNLKYFSVILGDMIRFTCDDIKPIDSGNL